MKQRCFPLAGFCILLVMSIVSESQADLKSLDSLIGPNDAVILMTDADECLYEKNADKSLIPASTLKILTALSAFHYLGKDFRFKTEFYLDAQYNLTIKGYGDPLLVSEAISNCTDALIPIIKQNTPFVRDIRFDDSFYSNLIVPGAIRGSSEPYDAPNGALCANFNTVNFYTSPDGHLVSAEAQTPLLPFVIKRIRSSGLNRGRILLNSHESRLYAAHLFRYFLEKKGMPVTGNIDDAHHLSSTPPPIFTWESPYSLNEIVSKLLEFSNNFIANQLFLTVGTRVFGTPGTLEKGVAALERYVVSELKLDGVMIAEGSGLSRTNRISAKNMALLLKEFQTHRFLMKKSGNTLYKTGTLDGISTRIGYISGPGGNIYRFVVFCNSPGKSSEYISRLLAEHLKAR